jgi:hypothetical protein
MAFRGLCTELAPPSIRDFVREHLDMQFADVHAMLRLPITPDQGLDAGCNFAAVSTLCGLIAGASTVFYRQDGSNRQRFLGVLHEYYPWGQLPTGGVSQETTVTALWDDYRNPLAHAWAVSTKEVGPKGNRRVIIDVNAKLLGVVKKSLTEEAIEVLEEPGGQPPSWLTPVVAQNARGGLDVYPHSLYWGARRLVEKLLADPERMDRTVAFFATMEPPPPS